QHVAGGDVRHTEFRFQAGRLGSLARTGRAQQDKSHDIPSLVPARGIRAARCRWPGGCAPTLAARAARSQTRCASPWMRNGRVHAGRGKWVRLSEGSAMSNGNLLYAQSGGVTAVINATAGAVLETARPHRRRVFAAHDGILGVLREDLFDASRETRAAIAALGHTPGGAFGSCRYKLAPVEADRSQYERIIAVCRAHDIRGFLYNGGNDSADTALKLSAVGAALGYDLKVIGVPKTVDNDLVGTDCCPGFGSVAKYTAVSVREVSLDVASMAETSTRVFVMEVMGRNAGWIAAAAGLAGHGRDAAPHLILFPERPFDGGDFLARVDATVRRVGWCCVVASEGVRHADGRFLS